jgi:hypothetical protein
MATLKQQEAKAQKEIQEFNSTNPVGTPVRVWPGIKMGDGVLTKTRSAAMVISCTASVFCEGVSGCIALSHVETV